MTLSVRQRSLLDRWLPGATVVRDHSWGQVETTVLEMIRAGSRFIVKAGGPADHHLEREIRAHRQWLGPWTSRGRAPALRHADVEAKLLVNRIAAGTVARLRDLISGWPAPPARAVPTHGDWQPRNWLVHAGVVSVIDFGRAAMRPAYTDFGRLQVQDFRDDPGLEKAFLRGYGSDAREADGWQRSRVREAIGTACWAFKVGDEPFEAQGHRMIEEVLRG